MCAMYITLLQITIVNTRFFTSCVEFFRLGGKYTTCPLHIHTFTRTQENVDRALYKIDVCAQFARSLFTTTCDRLLIKGDINFADCITYSKGNKAHCE